MLRVLSCTTNAQSSASTLRNHRRAHYDSNLSTINKDMKTKNHDPSLCTEKHQQEAGANQVCGWLKVLERTSEDGMFCDFRGRHVLRHTTAFSRLPTALRKATKQLLYQSILGNGCEDHISLPEQMVLGMNQF